MTARRRPQPLAPSTVASRRARARQAAGGAPGRWRHGRMPELWRCLVCVGSQREPCGALIEADERRAHLAAVHGRAADPTDPIVAAAFVRNNLARTTPTQETEP